MANKAAATGVLTFAPLNFIARLNQFQRVACVSWGQVTCTYTLRIDVSMLVIHSL